MEFGLRDNCIRVCGSARSAVYLLHNPAEFRLQYLIPMECPDGIHFSLWFGSLRTPERKLGLLFGCVNRVSLGIPELSAMNSMALRSHYVFGCTIYTRTHPALVAMQYSY